MKTSVVEPQATAGLVVCAQCGRPFAADTDASTLDELTAAMLLCPDCVAEDRRGDYDSGEAD